MWKLVMVSLAGFTFATGLSTVHAKSIVEVVASVLYSDN